MVVITDNYDLPLTYWSESWNMQKSAEVENTAAGQQWLKSFVQLHFYIYFLQLPGFYLLLLELLHGR